MIIITGSAQMSDDTRDEMVAISVAHSQRSRAEPGCIAHNVHIDCEDRGRLVFLEYWQDEPSIQAHFAVPESQSFVKRLRALSTGDPDLRIHHCK